MNPIGGGQWFTEKFFAQFHYVLVEIAFDTITIEARDRQGVTLDEVSWSQPVIAQPYAVIQATPNPATAGEPVHFDGTLSGSCGGSITGYSWRMGTGDVAFDPAFDYAYAAPGSYEVVLTVTDNDAQTAEARATIVVEAAGGDDAGDDSAPDDDDEGDDLGGDAGDDDDGCGC
jgi:PKD repeat protein